MPRRAGAGSRARVARASALAAGLAVAALGRAARAEGDVSFTLRPEVGIQGGSETFELSATLPTQGTSLTASSKLSYPVDTAVAGGSLALGAGRVTVVAAFLTNLANPWGTLLDQDFVSSGATSLEFSHTDSTTKLRTYAAELGVRVRVSELAQKPGTAPFHLSGGLRFESSIYDAYGIDGWQLDANANQVHVSLPSDVHGLHYRVQYFIPFVGAGVTLQRNGPFVFLAEARLLGSFSTHDDDHVLRNKAAHASVHGLGFGLVAEPAVDLGGGRTAHAFVGLSGQLQYLGAIDGRLTQHYYADDPSAPGDQVGVAIPDADFSFTSIRVRVLAFFAVKF